MVSYLVRPTPSGIQLGDALVDGDIRIVGLADSSPELGASGFAPVCAHAFTGVAAPTLRLSFFGKGSLLEAFEVPEVEELLGAAENFAAVIEHEAVFIGVEVEVHGPNFESAPVLTAVDVVEQFVSRGEPDEIDHGVLAYD